MFDLTALSVFDLIAILATFTPVALLAAFVVLDLRALMFLRVVSHLQRRMKPGETTISRDEWTPTALAARS